MATKKQNKVLNIVIDIVVIIILALALFLTVNTIISKASGKLYTSIGGNAYAVVKSNSMDGINEEWGDELSKLKDDYQGDWENGFSKGDIVIVKILSSEEKANLKVGDVVTFQTDFHGENILNTHRIIEISGEYYSTRGDNTEGKDNIALTKDDIIGKYEGGKIAGIGNINLFISTQVGFFVCVVLPTLLIVAYCIVKVVFAYREDKKQKAGILDETTDEIVEKRLAEEKEKMRQELLEEMKQNKESENAPTEQDKKAK